MKRFLSFAVVVSLGCAVAGAQTIPAPKTSVAVGEQAVATYFSHDSAGDVQLGELGRQKAVAASVRALADTMVQDHTRTGNDAMRLAKQIGDDQAALKPDDSQQIELTNLARYSGAAFDKQYLTALIDAHKSDISLVHDALEFARTTAVRAYLREALAIDTKHLHMAEQAQARTGG